MQCTNPQTIWPHRSIEWCDENEEKPVQVPCGKCLPCLMNKRVDWSFRLEQEYKHSKSAHFVTLTYDQKHYPSDGSLNKRDLQLYLKRLRKRDGNARIRYYAVGEYGSKSGRAHYHILLFNTEERHIRSAWVDSKNKPIGIVHVGTVRPASVAYVTKYIVQPRYDLKGLQKPFATMSRAYGIGGKYLTDQMVQWHRSDDRNYALRDGQKTRLPRFYREKIWYKPKDRERISSAAMKLTLENQKKENAYYEKKYGDKWEQYKADALRLVLSRVKQKVEFTQSF